MNDLIAVPTVEQINLEHQLANSKASEAVQHATNCGLMLLQVKANLSHGDWLPWLQATIDRGELKVGLRQSRKYMQLAANMHCEAHLLEAPSINAALELLSDKEPDEQGELIDGEAERQARIAAEQKAEKEQQRSAEWRDQWQQQRDLAEKTLGDLATALDAKGALQLHVAGLEKRIDHYNAQPAKKIVEKIIEKVIEKPVIPPEFASLEEAIAAKKQELNKLHGDTQDALAKNKTVYDYRAELQQEVEGLEALLSRHKAAEREMVEHKRLTDEAIHFTAVFLAELEALEHAPDATQRPRWQQAQQQFLDAARRIDGTFDRYESAPLEGGLLECVS